MKGEINPVVGAILIVIVVAVAGVLLWKGTMGDAAPNPPMGVGNAGPFSPGGAAVNKGGKPAAASSQRPPGGPGRPAVSGQPGGTGQPGGAAATP